MNSQSDPHPAIDFPRRALTSRTQTTFARSFAPLALAALLAAILVASLASCSVVFRSSIQGRIIDQEALDDGTTTGVADAKVFLYTDRAARDADLAAYAEGDESTLPDRLAAQKYFQSTVTDADGTYDFTGFIWETLFPKYGKTADRYEIFLLVYHADYGLWKNPVPLYVVSEVTNQLAHLAIEDLWNEGRLAGTVLDWKDDKGLGGVAVNFYVAESWTYDAAGNFSDPVYPSAPTATTTTDEDGRWAATVRFPMKPNRSAHAAYNKAPVRVAFARENYRANDPTDGTGLANAGLVTSVDIDRDGLNPAQEDYAEAFVESTLSYDATKGEAILGSIADIAMQRWRFATTVSGRVFDNDVLPTKVYVNSVEVRLAIINTSPDPDVTLVESKDITRSRTIGEITTDGHFDLGTIRWTIKDIKALGGGLEQYKSGTIGIVLSLDGIAPAAGNKNSITPDVALTLELGQ